ncbi:MAG TPA: anti-sigma factor [Candidatus Limnocylindrales bacterium]
MTCDRVREFASGFVLGALETDEMIAVQDHLDSCPKAHPEIDEMGGVLPYLAESLTPVEPPAWLRKSVIEAAKADLASRRLDGEPFARRVVGEPAALRQILPAAVAAPARVISLKAARDSRRRRAAVWFGRAAAAALIVVVAGYAAVVQTGVGKPHGTPDIFNYLGPDTRQAVLVAFDKSQAGGLAVLRPTGNIIVSVHNLQPTKGDQVYVVWLTADNGVPLKVGSFTVDDSGVGWLNVENAPSSQNLWIFLCKEPNSNVTKPTGPTIVSGTISL